MLRTVGRLILKLMAIVCIIGIVALLGILDVFLLLGYALHGLILACAGFMVLMMILVTQDWQTIGVVLAIVAGSSLVMFFGTSLTTLMRSIEFGLAEFIGSGYRRKRNEESLQNFCSDFLSLQSEYAVSVLNFQLIQLFSKLFKINGTKLAFSCI